MPHNLSRRLIFEARAITPGEHKDEFSIWGRYSLSFGIGLEHADAALLQTRRMLMDCYEWHASKHSLFVMETNFYSTFPTRNQEATGPKKAEINCKLRMKQFYDSVYRNRIASEGQHSTLTWIHRPPFVSEPLHISRLRRQWRQGQTQGLLAVANMQGQLLG